MKTGLKHLLSTTAIFLITLPFTSHAQMALNDSIVHFGSGYADRSDIEVSNSSTEPLYLRVTPYEIINPGTAGQQKVKIDNPKEAGLLVSPNKMVVAPNGRKLVRFVNLNKKSDEEKVYRVLFEPVSGEVKGDETGLKLLVGYEVLVLTEPNRLDSKLDAERTSSGLMLKNTGNSNIYLRGVKQCPDGDEAATQCINLQDKRLYPGNQWKLSLTQDWPVFLEMGVGAKWTRRVVQ